ncbi:MAG TPA: hypothetical protein VHW44_17085 [Pseudonocardiaceae bacterium]|jgi:hypothetical protein|nr:hypothetical protein [Pseudonocardiaceae bacterium]
MTTAQPDPVATVGVLLAAAGIPAGEGEIGGLAAAYEVHRAAVDAMYLAQGVRYADPALRFKADAPRITDWAVNENGIG